MKNYWKRVNRGLVLAGVLLTGTVIYVSADYIRFAKGKDDMQKLLENYCSELSENAALPQEKTSVDYKLSEDEKNAYYEKLKDTVKKFWTDPYDIDTTEYYVKSDVLNSYADVAFSEYPGKITEYNISADTYSFKKHGPGAATFSIHINYNVLTTGAAELPTLSGSSSVSINTDSSEIIYPDYDMSDIFIKDSETSEEETAYYKGNMISTGSCTAEGELVYVGGEWRINYFEFSHIPFTSSPVKGDK